MAFDLNGLYGDGANLYEYLGSSPWTRRDPMGLSWDPFDVVDDYLAEAAAERSAFLAQIGQDMKAIAVVAASIASIMPFPIVNVAGNVALAVLNGEDLGNAMGMSLALGLMPGGRLAGQIIGRFSGQIQARAFGIATQYAASYTSRLARGQRAVNLAQRARGALSVAFRLAGPPTVVYIAYQGGLPGMGGTPVYVGITSQKLEDRLRQHNKPSNRQGPRNFTILVPVTPPHSADVSAGDRNSAYNVKSTLSEQGTRDRA